MRRDDERHQLVRTCQRWATRLDVSTATAARGLGLSTRTLRAWAQRSSRPIRRGRPAHTLTPMEVRQMRAALIVHGPSASVATVQAWCPTASRRAIAAWMRQDRRRRRAALHVVEWQRPGRVWAMDFSEAPHVIDGAYRYLLHVRDLASACHLAALPVCQPTAATVCGLLQALARQATPPLVLKVDNGSAFVSHDLQTWAAAAGTRLLYSPPRCPRYNGAIEASIGSITTRAHHVAAAARHPGVWSGQDVEHART